MKLSEIQVPVRRGPAGSVQYDHAKSPEDAEVKHQATVGRANIARHKKNTEPYSREAELKRRDRAEKKANAPMTDKESQALYSKFEDAISNSFPDGDPIDYLGRYLEKNNFTMDDLDAAIKKHGNFDGYDDYLESMWAQSAADAVHDAKNGHIDRNSPFYDVDKSGKVTPTQNPWKVS